MNNTLRYQVLQSFKNLHRTRQKVFNNDKYALEAARKEINKGYRNKMNLNDINEIQQAVDYSKSVEKELRTTVVQAVETEPGKYTMRITQDTVKLDNIPFKDCGSS